MLVDKNPFRNNVENYKNIFAIGSFDLESSKMLIRYESDDGPLDFVRPRGHKSSGGNIITAIIGRNGTGKSRLLRSVVRELVISEHNLTAFTRDEQTVLKRESNGILTYELSPSQIICVSTSPFDKFPLLRRDQFTGGYSYLGLRGLPSVNLGLAYMSRIIFALIEGAKRGAGQAKVITGVLDHLGYEGMIQISLQRPPGGLLSSILGTFDPISGFEGYMKRTAFASEGLSRFRQLAQGNSARFRKIVELAKKIVPQLPVGRDINVWLDDGGVGFSTDPTINPKHMLELVLSGLFRLKDVTLSKKFVNRQIKLQDASSGEQAIALALLGIGSQIQNNSLICIDEPEVCLHPEWQEKYIELLAQTFWQYSGCHFLIATHSPQIIAQMPNRNCYVMSMEDRVTRRARDFSMRSIDFQLAEVFGAPGHRNEYLNRIALNAFARISKNKAIDEESLHTMHTLRKVASELHHGDPLIELIFALEEMVRAYG